MKSKKQEFLKLVGLPAYFALVMLLWFLAWLVRPELKTTGVGETFLNAGYVGGFVLLLMAIISVKFPKQQFASIVTGTWRKTRFRNILIAFVGGIALGVLANAQQFSVGQYSVIPLFTAATFPLLGVYSYVLNAPIEDVLFIATPRLFIKVLNVMGTVKKDPFISRFAGNALAFVLTGTIAMIAHVVSRGGMLDPSVAIVFGIFGIVANEWGFFTADALHMGLNVGIISTTFTMVV